MVWNEALKRLLPEGWNNCRLDYYIGRITNGLNPRSNFVLGGGDNYYITIRSLTGTDIDWDNCDRCDDAALKKINARSQLQVGDIIFSAIGTIGRTYLIQEPPTNWNISETSFTLRAKESVPPIFLYSLLRSAEIQMLADKAAMGSTLRCLVMESLKQVPTVQIPASLIRNYASRVDSLYKMAYQANKQIAELRKNRDELLPLLMNGQVSVRPLNNHFAERNRLLSSAFSKLRMYERRINPKNRGGDEWFPLRRTNAAVAGCGSGGAGRLYSWTDIG